MQESSPKKNFYYGMIWIAVLHVAIGLIYGLWALHEKHTHADFGIYYLIGIIQLYWVVPFILAMIVTKRYYSVLGALCAAALTFILSVAYCAYFKPNIPLE